MESTFITIIAFYLSVTCSESASVIVEPPNKFTYQASLRRIDPHDRNRSEHFCSAAIISDHYILTAAHCVSKPNVIVPEDLIIVTGAIHVRNGGAFHETEQIIVHELYYEAQEPMKYDIALAKTKTPIEFGRHVNRIPMAKDWVNGGVEGTTSGWKKHQEEPEIDVEHLMHYSVETLENQECVKRMDPTDSNLLSENTLCAAHHSETALGSTAAPLVTDNKLIGIGSWSASNHNGRSDQFIRISVFSSWINEHTNISAL